MPDEVRALLEGGTKGASATDAGAAAATTLRTFAAVSRLLGSGARPLVVLLEDLHWADHTSLRLLAYAAEELRGRPVLFVATVRTVDPRRHPVLAQALAGLARLEARRVPVPPLGEEAVAALLEDVLVDAEPALVEVLTRRTDGNPFFVLEMARLLAASGRATAEAAEHLEVPDGIADVLRMRVLQLAEPTRTALSVASVVGRTFDTRLLTAALGETVLDDLDEAVAAGIMEETGVVGQLRFVHALTRETVYGDLPLGRRARWHAQVGRALAERLARDPDLIGEVAHHHTLAAPYLPELAEGAVAFGRRAAMAAEARGAFDEALDALDAHRRGRAGDPGPRPGAAAPAAAVVVDRPATAGRPPRHARDARRGDPAGPRAGRLHPDGRGRHQLPQLRRVALARDGQ